MLSLEKQFKYARDEQFKSLYYATIIFFAKDYKLFDSQARVFTILAPSYLVICLSFSSFFK